MVMAGEVSTSMTAASMRGIADCVATTHILYSVIKASTCVFPAYLPEAV